MSKKIAHMFGPQSGMKEAAKKARPCDVYHADDGTDYVMDINGHWFAAGPIPVPQEEPAPEVSETPVAPPLETPEQIIKPEPEPEKPKKKTSKKKV